jgi:hypothetical protein
MKYKNSFSHLLHDAARTNRLRWASFFQNWRENGSRERQALWCKVVQRGLVYSVDEVLEMLDIHRGNPLPMSLFNFLTLTSLIIITDTCRRRAITFAYASGRARARICRSCTSQRKLMLTFSWCAHSMSRTRPSHGLPVKRLPRAPTLPPQVLSKRSGRAICKLHASPFCRLSSWLSDTFGSHAEETTSVSSAS